MKGQTVLHSSPLKNRKIIFFLCWVSLFLPGVHYAAKTPINWILDTKVNGVECYHSYTECNGEKVVFLKFINTNSYSVKLSWKELFITKQISEKRAGFSGMKEIVLAEGEMYPSNCAEVKNKKLIILPIDVSPAYRADIEKFEFGDITIVRIPKTN